MGDNVSYDSKSFFISGDRVMLISGSIHYFRLPRDLWRDVLLKAKLGGINTIQTYVAWNFHESEEGVFDFEGDRDLDYFLSLCEELGLWVAIRPGPYICAEWDFGGFPPWLLEKEGIQIRVYNEVFLEYVDEGFSAPVSEEISHEVLSLPVHPGVTEEGIEKIINQIKKFISQ